MSRRDRLILLAGVVGLVGLVILLMATPGSVMTAKTASGEPADRTAVAALVGLLVIGFAALGLDFEWLR